MRSTTRALSIALPGVVALMWPGPEEAAAQPTPAATAQPDPGIPSVVPAILTFTVNGAARGDIYVYLDGKSVLVRSEDLRAAGLGAMMGPRRLLEGLEYVSLATLDPPVQVALDEKEMTLGVEVDPSLLPITELSMGQSEAPEDMILGDGTSLFLNYSAHLHAMEERGGYAGYDGYAESGLAHGSWLLYSSAMANHQQQARGLTNLTYDDRARLRRFVLGDAVAGGDSLGGSVMVGGVQLARSFELDPYRVFRPSLGQTGVATTPSTAEFYVDGVLVRRAELPPGPFSAQNLPGTSGSGETRVVVRDALGREQTFQSSYYLPAAVLAPGVSEYSYTLGVRRQDAGQKSWGYDELALLASHRLGLRRWCSGGLRFEAGRRMASGGPSATFGAGFGEVTLAAAASVDDGRGGAAASITYGYSSRRLSLGLLARALTARYATTSLSADAERPTLELGSSLGLPLTRRMSMTAQVQHLTERDHGDSQRLSLTSSIELAPSWQLALSSSVTREREGGVQLAAFAGLTTSIDKRVTAAASQRVSRVALEAVDGAAPRQASLESSIELQRARPGTSGYGYRLRAQRTPAGQARGEAELELQGRIGRLESRAAWDEGKASGSVGVAGGVVLIGGRAFATRPVQRGFALLRMPGYAGVSGYLDNHYVGKTDARGDLVIPDLIPYYANRLSIDDTDLPLDATTDVTEQLIAPRNRSGVVVRFTARRMRAVRGSIVVDHGRHSAAYGELRLAKGGGEEEIAPVGSDGEFELANLTPGRHTAQLDYAGGSCTVALEVAERGRPIQELGAVACTPTAEARR